MSAASCAVYRNPAGPETRAGAGFRYTAQNAALNRRATWASSMTFFNILGSTLVFDAPILVATATRSDIFRLSRFPVEARFFIGGYPSLSFCTIPPAV